MNENLSRLMQAVNPDYYKWHPSGIECVTIAAEFPFCLGAALKYIWRAGRKDGESDVRDLHKAKRYLELEIERRERNRVKLYIRDPDTPDDAKAEPVEESQPIRIMDAEAVERRPGPTPDTETYTLRFSPANPSLLRALLVNDPEAVSPPNVEADHEGRDTAGDDAGNDDGELYVAGDALTPSPEMRLDDQPQP